MGHIEPGSTTIRIRKSDKEKLVVLCRTTHRGIVDMIAYLVAKEEIGTIREPRPKRKAG